MNTNFSGSCGRSLRSRRLLLIHVQWQRDRVGITGAYVTYRFTAAGLYLGILVAAGTTSNHPSFFFIYLTHLGLILQTAYLILSAALPVQELLNANNGGDP